ncbi:hypothetical protein ABW19_dt0201273 [Dactylella cylindrospora]|nr:hypothetical protein ABW19_dt0201273 [Dactylella cylindrospora]
MRSTLFTILVGLLFATAAVASSAWKYSPQNVAKMMKELREASAAANIEERVSVPLLKRLTEKRGRPRRPKGKYYNHKTKDFWVNGTAGAIPDVKFDVSESYAGLLPISKKSDESRKLYFWFWPTTGGPETKDDLVIWLNGGPGCSSLEGFLQENGPFTWKYGTFLPVQNKYTWVNLTNMVWIEQPVGTGFSEGEPNIKNEEDLAAQFLGFVQNFIDKFDLHGKRIWITGESYAGKYIPYIADAMFNRKDTKYFNIKGTLLYDPSIGYDLLQQSIPAYEFALRNNAILNIPDSNMERLRNLSEVCHYQKLYKEGMTFPPTGQLNTTGMGDKYACTGIWDNLWDVLGFPGSYGYLPEGAQIYFNRVEVQKAVNAPIKTWTECSDIDVFPKGDKSPPPVDGVLPRVIEKSERTVIAHGLLDYILLADGTLLSINNMIWGGKQGFSEKPSKKFMVPYEKQGEMGVWHEERGLTYIEIKMAGHMVPQYQPGAGYRHLEYLLGRVKDLSS